MTTAFLVVNARVAQPLARSIIPSKTSVIAKFPINLLSFTYTYREQKSEEKGHFKHFLSASFFAFALIRARENMYCPMR